MNSHTYEIVDGECISIVTARLTSLAALRHPHLITDVWGPGWAGYDRSIPLSVNVRRRAHRIAQLEASKRAHGEKAAWEAYEHEMAQARLNRWWFRSYREEPKREVDAWEAPEWVVDGMDGKGCADVKWDIVFTVS